MLGNDVDQLLRNLSRCGLPSTMHVDRSGYRPHVVPSAKCTCTTAHLSVLSPIHKVNGADVST